MPALPLLAELPPVRVFISYAHEDDEHDEKVRRLWKLLREHGIDARTFTEDTPNSAANPISRGPVNALTGRYN